MINSTKSVGVSFLTRLAWEPAQGYWPDLWMLIGLLFCRTAT